MNMRDYPILHFDTESTKRTALLFLFYISLSQLDLQL